jgi:hypothetical protein
VSAIWDVGDAGKVEEFVECRRQLFALRAQVLPTFKLDWLLRDAARETRFLVVGLHGDREAAECLCREHLEIQQYAAAGVTLAHFVNYAWFRSFKWLSRAGFERTRRAPYLRPSLARYQIAR